MITQFKIFEHVCELPKIGDYVILDSIQYNYLDDEILTNFINSNIGIIVSINTKHPIEKYFEVKFENINLSIKHYFNNKNDSLFAKIVKIKYWSENKEELKEILQANKYNL